LGKSPFDLFHPDYHPIMRERIRSLVEKNESVELIEEKIVRLDGAIRDIEVTAAPFMDAEGRAIQVILRDITQRKLSEAQVQKANAEVLQAYDATLQGWSNALELREHETAGHSKRVVHYTLALARALNVDADELIHIQRGALLHDIGKIGIPDTILNKPGPLDDAEWTTMRQHPIYAYNLLSSISYLAPALVIPYGHHERWNGAGYPRGLAGEQIPLAARIFAVVDVWDALSYDRPYRSAWSKEKVIQYLKDQSGIQFDPRILTEFLRLIEET
jgi:HD-GYP domain-containing protein (c-di-GMP phosphodiesterase class II)